jgi:hypothetical protein
MSDPMSWWRLVTVAALAVGCAGSTSGGRGAPSHSLTGVPQAQSADVADAGAPTAGTRCVDDTACRALEARGVVPKREGKIALCEAGRCEPYDEEVLWQWAKGVSVDLREFTLKEPKLSDASWFQPGRKVSLYLPENWQGETLKRRARCIALEFSARAAEGAEDAEEELVARVDESGQNWPAGHHGCSYSLVLSRSAVEFDEGCSTPTSSSGYGGAQIVGQFLSRADDTGLVYDGATAEITPYCSPVTLRRPGCDPAECHSCRIGLTVDLHVAGIGGRSNRRQELVQTLSDGSCPPCLPDAIAPLIPRLEAVLAQRTFYTELGQTDSLRAFRTKSGCEAHVLALESPP